METVFSVGSAPGLYKEDPSPAKIELRESLQTAVEDDLEEMTTSSVECKSAAVKRRLHVCSSYSETGIITVLKSVART
jgi:hypothetical protein